MSEIIVLEGNQRRGGLCGQVSWHLIVEKLKEDGSIKEGEKVVQIEASQHGISFTIEKDG